MSKWNSSCLDLACTQLNSYELLWFLSTVDYITTLTSNSFNITWDDTWITVIMWASKCLALAKNVSCFCRREFNNSNKFEQLTRSYCTNTNRKVFGHNQVEPCFQCSQLTNKIYLRSCLSMQCELKRNSLLLNWQLLQLFNGLETKSWRKRAFIYSYLFFVGEPWNQVWLKLSFKSMQIKYSTNDLCWLLC